MLPSFRHFLRFIELDDKFSNHGFQQKVKRFIEPTVLQRLAYRLSLEWGGIQACAEQGGRL